VEPEVAESVAEDSALTEPVVEELTESLGDEPSAEPSEAVLAESAPELAEEPEVEELTESFGDGLSAEPSGAVLAESVPELAQEPVAEDSAMAEPMVEELAEFAGEVVPVDSQETPVAEPVAEWTPEPLAAEERSTSTAAGRSEESVNPALDSSAESAPGEDFWGALYPSSAGAKEAEQPQPAALGERRSDGLDERTWRTDVRPGPADGGVPVTEELTELGAAPAAQPLSGAGDDGGADPEGSSPSQDARPPERGAPQHDLDFWDAAYSASVPTPDGPDEGAGESPGLRRGGAATEARSGELGVPEAAPQPRAASDDRAVPRDAAPNGPGPSGQPRPASPAFDFGLQPSGVAPPGSAGVGERQGPVSEVSPPAVNPGLIEADGGSAPRLAERSPRATAPSRP